MLIKFSNTNKVANSEKCLVSEYLFGFKDISFATALVNGRYPNTGRHRNTLVDEVLYVLSGSGIVHSQGEDYELREGDAYLNKKNHWLAIEGDNLRLAMFSTPGWSFEQLERD